MDCLFCKISQEKVPAKIIYRDDLVLAFHDIHPVAPYHILIVPHKHIDTVNAVTVEDDMLIAHMVQTAKHLAKENQFAESGYRLVMNCNLEGGQTIFHIHIHLLGGRVLNWPPG